jgi:KTSC domain
MVTPIQYKPVESSNIRALAYDNGVAYVEFHGGRRFAYTLPRKVFDEMTAAKSIGGYFSKNVRSKYAVYWHGCRCDLSPCQNDATVTGSVNGTKFSLCDECGKAARYSQVKLTPLVER